MDIYKNHLQGIYFNKINEFNLVEERIKRLSAEIEGLKKGIKPYGRKLLELKYEIEAALCKKYGIFHQVIQAMLKLGIKLEQEA